MGRLVKRFGRLVPSQVLDARDQADAILRVARSQADALVASAGAEADSIRSQARQMGKAEGRAEAEIASTSLMLAAHREAEKTRAEALQGARTLAMRMAEKIVGRAVQLDPEALAHIVTDALTAARARSGTVVLRVHPDDLAGLEITRPALLSRVATAVQLRLVADATVGRAGCVVETSAGRLDARLQTQLLALEHAVFGADTTSGDGSHGG